MCVEGMGASYASHFETDGIIEWQDLADGFASPKNLMELVRDTIWIRLR